MASNLVNFLGKVFQPKQAAPLAKTKASENPFANPFVSSSTSQNRFYGKNKPVVGGYFAGYYNGKANIVGTRLFVEV